MNQKRIDASKCQYEYTSRVSMGALLSPLAQLLLCCHDGSLSVYCQITIQIHLDTSTVHTLILLQKDK